MQSYIKYQNHQTQHPATYFPIRATWRVVDRMIGIIICIINAVTQEGAAVKVSFFSLSAQLVHDGTTHNWRVHTIECDIKQQI
jgi:hypothetical protein